MEEQQKRQGISENRSNKDSSAQIKGIFGQIKWTD